MNFMEVVPRYWQEISNSGAYEYQEALRATKSIPLRFAQNI